jgi:hypothetical protein
MSFVTMRRPGSMVIVKSRCAETWLKRHVVPICVQPPHGGDIPEMMQADEPGHESPPSM